MFFDLGVVEEDLFDLDENPYNFENFSLFELRTHKPIDQPEYYALRLEIKDRGYDPDIFFARPIEEFY